MIENPGETPDFAIFASLNKDGAFPASRCPGAWSLGRAN